MENGRESEVDIWENTNSNAAKLVNNIFGSEEAAKLYTTLGKEGMVKRLYKAIFGREADSSGIATFTALMTSDNWFDINTNVIRNLVNSGEAQNIYAVRGIGEGTI